MFESEPESGEIVCPQCGDTADWSAADPGGTHVEINCAVCGCFSMTALQPAYVHLGLEPGVRERRSPDPTHSREE